MSVIRSRIKGARKVAFMSALRSLDAKCASLLIPNLFARSIRKFATPVTSSSYYVDNIEKELARVLDNYSKKSAWYDKDDIVYSVEVKLNRRSNETTQHHMKIKLDPKTVKHLTDDENRDVTLVQLQNFLQNLETDKKKIKGISLPESRSSTEECTVEELKAMIIYRGSISIGKDVKSLSR